MADKLDMALDDLVPKKGGKGGGSGGKMGGKGAGKQARAAMAAPYQRPGKGAGKGKGKGGATLESMSASYADNSAAAPAFSLTTGTTVKVANLDYSVTGDDLQELFGEIGVLKEVSLLQKPDGTSKGVALVVYRKKADAEAAVERYHGVPLDGRPLKIYLQQKVVVRVEVLRRGCVAAAHPHPHTVHGIDEFVARKHIG